MFSVGRKDYCMFALWFCLDVMLCCIVISRTDQL